MDMIYDLLIIGGGSAGLSAGIYAGRAQMKTLIMEKLMPGGQLLNTAEVVNYPGVRSTSGPQLMEEMQLQATDFGVAFISENIDKVDFSDTVKVIYSGTKVYRGYSVIIASGALPKKVGFKGEDDYTGRGVSYCSTCDGGFFKGLDLFVIGGGYAATEEALYLTRFARSITMIVRKGELSCPASVQNQVFAHPKIKVAFHTEIVEAGGDTLLQHAIFKNNQTGETFRYDTPKGDRTFGIFVFAGYAPETALFKDWITLDKEGYVLTDEKMMTNIEGVYAAGDLRPKELRQIVTAVADGAIAATSAEKYVTQLKEKLGILDEPVGMTPPLVKQADTSSGEGASETKEKEFFTPDVKNQIVDVFSKLEKKLILLTLVDQDNSKSLELLQFAEEIASLSPKIEVQSKAVNSLTPEEVQLYGGKDLPVVWLLREDGSSSGVAFRGIPGGHETTSFVLAVYNLAGPGQSIDDSLRERILRLKAADLKVCISLSCRFCPDVVVAAQRIAILNPKVTAQMVDVSLFPDFQQKHNIMSVPTLIIDDQEAVIGAKSLEEMVALLEKL